MNQRTERDHIVVIRKTISVAATNKVQDNCSLQEQGHGAIAKKIKLLLPIKKPPPTARFDWRREGRAHST
ncbi:hypothetical protein E2562_013708 [Oryza meyeriana var. granulata]|uniref:Uncharacterized protein n=1 Tax=Oryza meyeriana var. granulata TaxID=110450 RepID=A0A6G1BJY6_9ORYZ|nr:hypothetical protein E2562_013708 [Oryza meyeriana var. granulata]